MLIRDSVLSQKIALSIQNVVLVVSLQHNQPKLPSPMNLQNFKKHIDPTIVKRGKDYADDGHVTTLEEEEDGVWSAEVEGSEVYSVEVRLSGDGEIGGYSCDCPHDADVCKHIVAVFYELKDLVKTIKLKPEKIKNKALSFSELLNKVSVSELREFVELFARNDKNFKNQCEIHFAHKDEKIDVEKKYKDLVKKIIHSSMSRGFVDYYSSGDLSAKIDTILAKAQEAIQIGTFKDASIVACVVLKQLVEDVIPNADDSNGDIGGSIFTAANILTVIAQSELCSREVKESLHDFLADELESDTYFNYGDFGYDLFATFRYLSAQLNRSEVFLSFSSRLPGKSSESSSDYRTEYFIKQTILYFQEIGNTKEAERLVMNNLQIVDVRWGVVAKAIERKKYEDAKELVYQGITVAEKKGHPGTVSEWQKVLLQIANLEGDVTLQRHFNLLFAFDRSFDEKYYLLWKETFAADVWENELIKLVLKITEEVEVEARKNRNSHWWSKSNALLKRLAPIYVAERQWGELFKLVEAYPSLDVLLTYAKYLASDFPAELIDFFVPALIIAGDRADSRSGYAQVASNMKIVLKLLPTGKIKILEAAQTLRAKYPKRPAMLDELKTIR